MDYYQTFASNCPTTEITVDGITFQAAFESCDPFSNCDAAPLPQSTADLLGGDQFALQFGVFDNSDTGVSISLQAYAMRVGRSIVTFEYAVRDEPTDEQFGEASTSAIAAWTRAAILPD